MDMLANLDLLTVGIMVATTCVFGFVVYFNNKESITNKIFLLLSLVIAIWGIFNYFAYQFYDPFVSLWFVRGIIFFGVFQSLLLYVLFRVFPSEDFTFSNADKYIIIPSSIFIAILTLTPFVLSGFEQNTTIVGKMIGISKGPLWILFPIVAAGLVFLAVYVLIKKIIAVNQSNRKPLFLLLIGISISYFLILTFNLFLPILFSNTSYIPLSSVFILPFIALTAYAILKFNLFNLKVTETMLLMVILLVATFLQVTLSHNITEIIFRSFIFLLVLLITILLLNVVVRELHQKRQLEELHIKLKELDQLKSEFTSLATHHISSPLTAVNGYISLLKEESYNLLTLKGKEMLNAAEQSTNNLITVVRDFLDITRLDTSKVTYHFTEVNILEIIGDVIQKYKYKVEGKEIKFNLKNKAKKLNIIADREALQQAISNILDNSLKYTKEGFINIILESDLEKATVTISDKGIRNLPTTSTSLQRKFSQTSNEFEANLFGSSLGLYAAKQIIEANNGYLNIYCKESSTYFYILLQKII